MCGTYKHRFRDGAMRSYLVFSKTLNGKKRLRNHKHDLRAERRQRVRVAPLCRDERIISAKPVDKQAASQYQSAQGIYRAGDFLNKRRHVTRILIS